MSSSLSLSTLLGWVCTPGSLRRAHTLFNNTLAFSPVWESERAELQWIHLIFLCCYCLPCHINYKLLSCIIFHPAESLFVVRCLAGVSLILGARHPSRVCICGCWFYRNYGTAPFQWGNFISSAEFIEGSLPPFDDASQIADTQALSSVLETAPPTAETMDYKQWLKIVTYLIAYSINFRYTASHKTSEGNWVFCVAGFHRVS